MTLPLLRVKNKLLKPHPERKFLDGLRTSIVSFLRRMENLNSGLPNPNLGLTLGRGGGGGGGEGGFEPWSPTITNPVC